MPGADVQGVLGVEGALTWLAGSPWREGRRLSHPAAARSGQHNLGFDRLWVKKTGRAAYKMQRRCHHHTDKA